MEMKDLPETTNLLRLNSSIKKYLMLLFVASLCIACNEQTVYHAFKSLPTKGWNITDTLQYNVAIADSATTYNMIIEVRNRNNYPYQNLVLQVQHNYPDQKDVKRDTLVMMLADSEGVWQGKGWGGLYLSATTAYQLRVDKPGDYCIKITHLFADDYLVGINDVGIKLSR